MTAVAIHERALAAHGLARCDVSHAVPGTVLVLLDGTALRVTRAGGLDPTVPFGWKSIASDPTAAPRGAR